MTATAQLGWAHDLLMAGDYVELAERLQAQAIEEPTNNELRLLLAEAHIRLGHARLAETNLAMVLRTEPNNVEAILALAKLKMGSSIPTESMALFSRAAGIDPAVSLKIGNWFQERGKFDESELFLRKALERDPRSGPAYLALAESSRLVVDDRAEIERVLSILNDARTDTRNRMYLCFALGRAFDQASQYERAAGYFQRANDLAFEIHGNGQGFNSEVMKGYPDKIAQIYSKQSLCELQSVGSSSDKPILIVGMIRSGTTLLDQMVTAHPLIAAAGELSYWRIAGDRFNRTWYTQGIDSAEIKRLQEPYLHALSREAGVKPRVTDKMPLNFELLGMILMAFPHAKILHIRRNPADTCLSVFQNYYGGSAIFAYNWANIVTYYRAYLRFMELWRSILPPDAMLEIDYESLVSQKEDSMRAVIKFLGLEWNAACTNPEANIGHVETPSKWQARQPVYSRSISRWKNYSQWYSDLNSLNELRHFTTTHT